MAIGGQGAGMATYREAQCTTLLTGGRMTSRESWRVAGGVNSYCLAIITGRPFNYKHSSCSSED